MQIYEVDQSSFASISQIEVTHSAIAAHIYVVERELVTNERFGVIPIPVTTIRRRHYIMTSYSDVTVHYTALRVFHRVK